MVSFYNKHIAATGKHAGKWVTCPAIQSCRIKGVHVPEEKFAEIQAWAGKRAVLDVTVQDYSDYIKSELNGTLEEDRRPMETLEQKRERLGVDELIKAPRKRQLGTHLRETMKNRASMPEDEYYKELYQEFPALLEKSVEDQREVERLIRQVHKNKNDYTRVGHILRDWDKNKQFDDLNKLEGQVNLLYGQGRRGPDKWTIATSEEIEAKLRQKTEEAIAHERVERIMGRRIPNAVQRAQVDKIMGHNTPVQAIRPANPSRPRIPDYVPLNDDSTASKIALERLQSYEIQGTGALGRKSNTDKVVEFMVRNQITITGKSRNYEFHQHPAVNYLAGMKEEVKIAYKNVGIMRTVNEKSPARLLKELEDHVEQTNSHNQVLKQSHDTFVSQTKKDLLQKAIDKGYENDGNLLNSINDSTKASQLYDIAKKVRGLKQQDEFSRAGL